MSVIAFIPARGGSKSIPLKNIKSLCGKPLIYWSIKALNRSIVDKIVVATDSDVIRKTVLEFNFSKVEIYDRDSRNATDDASTESVMLEYIEKSELLDSDIFMLVQATSPFTQTHDFNKGLTLFNNYDSVITCTVSKRFSWNENGIALNYDINNRPRRQTYSGDLIENGAFYISTVANIKLNRNRISGNIGIYKMPEYSALEIDEAIDLDIAELIMKKFILSNNRDFSKIKILLSDVDGVLTDAGMYYTENGDEIKKFSTYDGMAFKLLKDYNIKVGIITSEDRNLNKRRADKLDLDFQFHGAINKLQIVKELCDKEFIELENIAYIGDDINCYELLCNVGIAACPNNAMDKIKSIPGIISLSKKGGDGVLREFIDMFF